MAQSILLSSPALLLLLGAALGLCLFDRFYRATRGVFTLLGTVLGLIGCGCALIMGAGPAEVGSVLLALTILMLGGWK